MIGNFIFFEPGILNAVKRHWRRTRVLNIFFELCPNYLRPHLLLLPHTSATLSTEGAVLLTFNTHLIFHINIYSLVNNVPILLSFTNPSTTLRRRTVLYTFPKHFIFHIFGLTLLLPLPKRGSGALSL